MTAEIVNLRRKRKDNARRERERAAATRRAQFGRAKTERTAAAHERARRESLLDGAKREGDATGSGRDDPPG